MARPRISQWGATDQEHQAIWPGDHLVDRPSYVWTNAITIQAPAARVWPWLVQLGQGRGGLYSYDWLENHLLGCDVHSTDSILPQFQQPLQVGDRVIKMARYAPSNPVALVEPERALVLGHIKDNEAELAAGQARSSWAFILQPVDSDSTRFIIRCRGSSLMARLQGPVQFVMQRKMMLGIKQRAEGTLPALEPSDRP
ncbi:MAG TPA: SRPBCC family protein [Actinomycetes bacterium]|nr:SRPBCC family protein [Actinomycetes bacterium]